jgi:hypothetical protein
MNKEKAFHGPGGLYVGPSEDGSTVHIWCCRDVIDSRRDAEREMSRDQFFAMVAALGRHLGYSIIDDATKARFEALTAPAPHVPTVRRLLADAEALQLPDLTPLVFDYAKEEVRVQPGFTTPQQILQNAGFLPGDTVEIGEEWTLSAASKEASTPKGRRKPAASAETTTTTDAGKPAEPASAETVSASGAAGSTTTTDATAAVDPSAPAA